MTGRVRVTTTTCLMAVILVLSRATGARAQTPLPEKLLTPADLERAGVKGTVRPSAEMYNPAEGLHFVTGSDSTLVLQLSPLSDEASPGTFRTSMQLIAKDLAAVSGVGDEAYTGLGGWMLAFRKGKKTYQMLTGVDVAHGAKVFLTPAQMVDLAKTFVGRL